MMDSNYQIKMDRFNKFLLKNSINPSYKKLFISVKRIKTLCITIKKTIKIIVNFE